MDFNEYQKLASTTAQYNEDSEQYKFMYLSLGLAGEVGEVVEKVKKLIRNDKGVLTDETRKAMAAELGDVLWYLSQIALLLNVPFEDVAKINIEKLRDRYQRGVIKSEGDNR